MSCSWESNVQAQEMSEPFIFENFIVVTREVLNEVILKFRIFSGYYKNLKEVKINSSESATIQ